jgi:hypothetical protein
MNKKYIFTPKQKQPDPPKELVMSEELKEAIMMYVFKQVIPILSISSSFIYSQPLSTLKKQSKT